VNEYVQDSRATLEVIKVKIQNVTIDISIEHTKRNLLRGEQLEDNPGVYLIKYYNQQAKMIHKDKRYNTAITNIKYTAKYQLIKENIIFDRGIKETIRIVDSRKAEYEYTYRKFEDKVKLINLKARNLFSKSATTSNIKCSIKFNHYSMRDILINSRQVDNSCLQCNDKED
jgi:hypothetical protein